MRIIFGLVVTVLLLVWAAVCGAIPLLLFCWSYDWVLPPETAGEQATMVAIGNLTGMAGLFLGGWLLATIGDRAAKRYEARRQCHVKQQGSEGSVYR